MDIVIALDGPRERNLDLYAGDEVTFTLTVFASDGDTVPLTVTDARVLSPCWPASLDVLVGTEFIVPDNVGPRSRYTLVGEIAGVTKTLAYGLLLVEGSTGCYRRWDYGALEVISC